MQVAKRVIIWSVEVVAEVILLGGTLGLLVAGDDDDVTVVTVVGGTLIALPVLLFLNGYYLTRALAGFAWMTGPRWLYPLLATGAFLGHVGYIIANSTGTNFTPAVRSAVIPFLAIGTSGVFTCAYLGNWLFRKWAREGAPIAPTIDRSVQPPEVR